MRGLPPIAEHRDPPAIVVERAALADIHRPPTELRAQASLLVEDPSLFERRTRDGAGEERVDAPINPSPNEAVVSSTSVLLPDETDSPEFVQAATELERASEEGGGISTRSAHAARLTALRRKRYAKVGPDEEDEDEEQQGGGGGSGGGCVSACGVLPRRLAACCLSIGVTAALVLALLRGTGSGSADAPIALLKRPPSPPPLLPPVLPLPSPPPPAGAPAKPSPSVTVVTLRGGRTPGSGRPPPPRHKFAFGAVGAAFAPLASRQMRPPPPPPLLLNGGPPSPPAPPPPRPVARPDFAGTWRCTRVEGAWDEYLTCEEVSWLKRQALCTPCCGLIPRPSRLVETRVACTG